VWKPVADPLELPGPRVPPGGDGGRDQQVRREGLQRAAQRGPARRQARREPLGEGGQSEQREFRHHAPPAEEDQPQPERERSQRAPCGAGDPGGGQGQAAEHGHVHERRRARLERRGDLREREQRRAPHLEDLVHGLRIGGDEGGGGQPPPERVREEPRDASRRDHQPAARFRRLEGPRPRGGGGGRRRHEDGGEADGEPDAVEVGPRRGDRQRGQHAPPGPHLRAVHHEQQRDQPEVGREVGARLERAVAEESHAEQAERERGQRLPAGPPPQEQDEQVHREQQEHGAHGEHAGNAGGAMRDEEQALEEPRVVRPRPARDRERRHLAVQHATVLGHVAAGGQVVEGVAVLALQPVEQRRQQGQADQGQHRPRAAREPWPDHAAGASTAAGRARRAASHASM
jgi:hypothetical protein